MGGSKRKKNRRTLITENRRKKKKEGEKERDMGEVRSYLLGRVRGGKGQKEGGKLFVYFRRRKKRKKEIIPGADFL